MTIAGCRSCNGHYYLRTLHREGVLATVLGDYFSALSRMKKSFSCAPILRS